MSVLKIFTNQVLDYSQQLINLCPNEETFRQFNVSVMLLKKTNPKKIIDLFSLYIYPYKEQILNEDESFFTNKDYKVYENQSTDESLFDTIHILKNHWENISNQNKKNIWNFFKIFIILKERYDSHNDKNCSFD